MKCSDCGYILSDLDATCPRCARMPADPAGDPSAPHAGVLPGGHGSPPLRIHFQRKSHSGTRAALLASAVAVCLLVAASVVGVWIGIVMPRKRAQANRLSAVLARLRMQYPDRRFALIEGFGRPTRMAAPLRELRVDSVTLSRSDQDRMEATVEFTSVTNRAVAPTIFVSLFDDNGSELARSGVVRHIASDLA